MGQLKDEQVSSVRLYEIVDSISDTSFDFSKRTVDITPNLKGLNRDLIRSMSSQAAVTGVNGTVTTNMSSTPVTGTLYYLTVITNQQDSGQTKHYKFQWVCGATQTLAALSAGLVAVIQAHPDYAKMPFTAAVSTNDVRLTETTPSGYVAGEVTILDIVTSQTATAVTKATHTDAYGQGTTLARIKTLAGSAFKGTPNTSNVYTTITIDYFDEYDTGNPVSKAIGKLNRHIIYIDTTTLSATDANYIISAIKSFGAELNLIEGDYCEVTSVTTTAAGSAIIPKGTKNILVTSDDAAYFIGLQADLPIGTEINFITGGIVAKVKFPTGESCNGGTTGTSHTLTASAHHKYIKHSSVLWYCSIWLLSGVHSTDNAGVTA